MLQSAPQPYASASLMRNGLLRSATYIRYRQHAGSGLSGMDRGLGRSLIAGADGDGLDGDVFGWFTPSPSAWRREYGRAPRRLHEGPVRCPVGTRTAGTACGRTARHG